MVININHRQLKKPLLTTFAVSMTTLETKQKNISIADEHVFEELFRKYYDGLSKYCMTIIKNQESAEDIVQSCFMELWNDRKTLAIHTSVQAYLYKNIYFKCMNKIKHEKVVKKHQSILSQSEEVSLTDSLIYKEIEGKIKLTIEGLPEQCRKIFKMHRFDGLKYTEIAQKLELSPKTVENHMGRALKTLRVGLAEFIKIILITLNLLQ